MVEHQYHALGHCVPLRIIRTIDTRPYQNWKLHICLPTSAPLVRTLKPENLQKILNSAIETSQFDF